RTNSIESLDCFRSPVLLLVQQTPGNVRFCTGTRSTGMTAKRRSTHVLSVLLALLLAIAWQAVAASPAGADGERHGLRGDYYLSSGPGAFDFAELKATIVDSKIEMPDLEPVFRDLTGRTDDITVRWTGRIRPEFSETYTFSMIGDNGYRLWV